MITGKRKFREFSDETKEKISTSTMERLKTTQHKANISKGMQVYWKDIPNRPTLCRLSDWKTTISIKQVKALHNKNNGIGEV